MDEAKKETEVGKVIVKMNKRISQMEETAKQLSARLTGIIRGGTNEIDKASVPEFSVPLAQEINQAVCRLDKIDADLQDLRNRIEL